MSDHQRNKLGDLSPSSSGTQTTTYRSAPIDVSQYANLTVQLSHDATYAGTLKVYGSLQSATPAPATANSLSNQKALLGILDLDSGAVLAGNTGVVTTAASALTRLFDVQCVAIKWLWVEVVPSAGSFDVTIMKASNK